jgi:hypothetical protein
MVTSRGVGGWDMLRGGPFIKYGEGRHTGGCGNDCVMEL